MSIDTESTTPETHDDSDEAEAFVAEHRDRIERVAASDLPVAEYYQSLLDSVDGGDDDV